MTKVSLEKMFYLSIEVGGLKGGYSGVRNKKNFLTGVQMGNAGS